MAHDVFISYAKENKVVADAMCAILEQRQIRCWIAPRDVLPGQAYSEAIVEALGQVQVLVLLFSSFANTSPQVAREVERAVAKRVAILPFRLEDVPLSKHMEYFISTPHWLDALAPPHEHHFARLGDAIEALLAQRQGKTPPPLSRWPGARLPQSETLSGWNTRRTITALSLAAFLAVAVFGYSRWQAVSPPAQVASRTDEPDSATADTVVVPEAPLPVAPPPSVAPSSVPESRSPPEQRPSRPANSRQTPPPVAVPVEVRSEQEAQTSSTERGRPRRPDETSPSSPRYRRPERWQDYVGFDELVGRWRGQDRDGLVIEMDIPDTDAAEVQATVSIPSMACSMSVNLVQATEQFTTSQFYWKKIVASSGCPDMETLYTNPVLNVMTWRFTFPSGQNAQIVMDRRI